jgi:hypothetical protein
VVDASGSVEDVFEDLRDRVMSVVERNGDETKLRSA